ncbi:protein ALP1-like [Rosa chinensis]|uniref:protein ALP1-like n=1 Tax=Rosa chinensis TaxID=74649 RepID=UPI001AD90761|nr:protein ALP1-like [Rosa chinensis]
MWGVTVVLVIGFLMLVMGAQRRRRRFMRKQPSRSEVDEKNYRRMLWMRVLEHESTCFEQLRMKPAAFEKFCALLRDRGGLGALGALDGTFIDLTVPIEDKPRYRNRKGDISTNVLGVCDANMKFIYVSPGWEGSAADSRVLRDALTRRNGLKIQSNKYYLVDAGYTNGPGFLAPYRGTRYHLNLWRGNTPRDHKELFNLRHSSARNTIERAFGLLKKRWAILRTASFFDVKTQVRIINACCIIHNYLRDEMPNDQLLDDVDRDLENTPEVEDEDVDDENIRVVKVTREWTTFRDALAMEMFAKYQAIRRAQDS